MLATENVFTAKEITQDSNTDPELLSLLSSCMRFSLPENNFHRYQQKRYYPFHYCACYDFSSQETYEFSLVEGVSKVKV